ncbi:MAG TPA: membrane protein insertion efficiency factor YidD [Candidatus Parcubacteria bacterium]|jgi:hypothetical protein|nr:membrane protein insertion efficiency factor YidD [Parcubacteria group bacterium]HJN62012.1 membrane protein insertion efficiency factor YidD [Candidatus Parcubacteria bacterium]
MFKNITLKSIKFYQAFISPSLGGNCRFYPTCSEYTYKTIGKDGVLIGTWKGLKRILKCHPWNEGGVDLP